MALQTKIAYTGSNASIGTWLVTMFERVGFAFESTGDYRCMYVRFTDAEKKNYVGFWTQGAGTMDAHFVAKIDGTYVLDHLLESINNTQYISTAWDDDFLTIHAAKDSGFPSTKIDSGDNCGIYIARSGDTWTAGIVYSTGSELQNNWNAWKIVSADDRTHPSADAQYGVFALNYAAEVMETVPCLGRSQLCPDKISLISATPEQRIASAGWITVNGKEYYKNGIFLIDAEK